VSLPLRVNGNHSATVHRISDAETDRASVLEFFRGQLRFLTGLNHASTMLCSMPNQSVCSNDYPFVTTFPASQPWDAPDPLPVMRREMKLLLIEIGQLRTEVEQLRAKEEEAQNVKEFLYRVIESRDQWQREAQRLRALMAKVPPWLLFCGRCLDAFKASREGSEGFDLHQSPSQCL
jgi:hypothetical protein